MAKVWSKVMLLCAVFMVVFASSSLAASENVAPKAKITASSLFNDDNHPNNVADGKKQEHGVGEWASLGEQTPWIKLEWDQPVTIDRIVIYDRPNEADNANGGTFTFSDGSTLDMFDIDPQGKPTEITFEPKTVTSLQFDILGGAGFNVGLIELEVFTSDSGGSATADSSAGNNAAASESSSVTNPKTGDSGVMLYALISAVSLLAIVFMFVRKRFSKAV